MQESIDQVPEAFWPVVARLAERATLPVMLLDSEGRIIWENRAAQEMLGNPVGEPGPTRGRIIFELPNILEAGAAGLMENILGGHEINDVLFDLVSAAGRPVSMLLSGGAVRGADGAVIGAWLSARDLGSEANQAGRLLALQRLEILGLSVTGVIHDLNNTLTGLGGALELMRGGQQPSNQLLGALDAMVRRSQDIASRLLEVSRPGEPEREPMDLRTPVRQALDLMRHGLGPGIAVVASLPQRQVPVECARTNLLQCFFNLGTNARDAMEGKGTVELVLEVVSDREFCAARGWEGQRYARIRFSDSGPGIPAGLAERIWEPFYTTKPGTGTGMGLAVVYRAVLDHDGLVRLVPGLGSGATFEICLPMYEGFVEDDEPTRTINVPRQLNVQGPPLAGHRVLIADDEAALRLVLDTGLSLKGAEVMAVEDGPTALAAAQAALDSGAPFHSAIVDLHMPGLDGVELISELRARHPDLRIIITSGLEPEAETMGELLGLSARFLGKPFRLVHAVEAVLGS